MGTYVVSGSASGIGAAVTARLRDHGHTVIGVDLRDAEVTGDLATTSGRDTALAAVGTMTDRVDGVVPARGSPDSPGPTAARGVAELLRRGPAGERATSVDGRGVERGPDELELGDLPTRVERRRHRRVPGRRRGQGPPTGRARGRREHLPRHQGSARVLDTARGDQARLGRRWHPGERGGTRADRHPDDRAAAQRSQAGGLRRRLPDRARAAGSTRGGRGTGGLPALRAGQPAGRLRGLRRRRHRRAVAPARTRAWTCRRSCSAPWMPSAAR